MNMVTSMFLFYDLAEMEAVGITSNKEGSLGLREHLNPIDRYLSTLATSITARLEGLGAFPWVFCNVPPESRNYSQVHPSQIREARSDRFPIPMM